VRKSESEGGRYGNWQKEIIIEKQETWAENRGLNRHLRKHGFAPLWGPILDSGYVYL
jgi:hypothetical protein